MTTDLVAALLLNVPPCQWEATVDELIQQMHPSEPGDHARNMEDTAGRLAFLAEYLAHRSGSIGCGPQDHKTAVKRANAQCRRVNKAMGYNYPDRRLFRI